MRCGCGSEWFVEERMIRPAGTKPNQDERLATYPKETRYRLVCAECGARMNKEGEPIHAQEQGRGVRRDR